MIPATITPLPVQVVATFFPTATDDLVKRQSIVTLSVTASQSPTAAPTKSKAFPVAVAIPALVGGMAVAIGGFLLWWWISKRRRREKRLRWEAHQRKMQARKKSNAASSRRPSASADRGGQKSPTNEKAFVPPVPTLPKHAHQAPQQQYQPYQPYHQEQHYGKPEQEYGYRHEEYSNYAPQPSIEPPVAQPEPTPTPVEEPKKSSKPSRSAARIAAAEKAAEAAHGDVNTRYQPKKPSPLAIKAQEKAAAERQEHLDPSSARQVSGEWGVALGSPNHDGSFSAQQQVQPGTRASYSNDPYLNGVDARAKSGVYSYDPYASYHGDEMEEMQPQTGSRDKRNWV